tara:strand:- start:1729 stop:1950 length:222 start_codon:yes stop_codon:yes gene_type:complete
MAPIRDEQNKTDTITSLITTVGVVGGLSGLAVVITGGFITANAVRTGLRQVPLESPVPLRSSSESVTLSVNGF